MGQPQKIPDVNPVWFYWWSTVSDTGPAVNQHFFAVTILTLNPYRAGIDFSRQNLTTKVDTRAVGVKIFLMAVDP